MYICIYIYIYLKREICVCLNAWKTNLQFFCFIAAGEHVQILDPSSWHTWFGCMWAPGGSKTSTAHMDFFISQWQQIGRPCHTILHEWNIWIKKIMWMNPAYLLQGRIWAQQRWKLAFYIVNLQPNVGCCVLAWARLGAMRAFSGESTLGTFGRYKNSTTPHAGVICVFKMETKNCIYSGLWPK